MLAEIVLCGWLTQTCFITGDVVWSQDQATAHLSTPCPIEIRVEGAVVKLTSPKWYVEIALPEEPAAQSFFYRWGQAEAQIGDHTVKVSYGPIGGI